MGSPPDEEGRAGHEGPVHQVTLSVGLYVGECEITQGQWERVMDHNPSHFSADGPQAPVENVTWDDCREFCRRLCELEGVAPGTYRMLSEVEWEYACRAGTQTSFCQGDELDESTANFGLGPTAATSSGGADTRATVSTGQLRSNAWGLHDTHGNVYEWCNDWYADDVYGRGSAVDPAAPETGEQRVTRGGSYRRGSTACRSASRQPMPPQKASRDLGLRIARVLAPSAEPVPGSVAPGAEPAAMEQ